LERLLGVAKNFGLVTKEYAERGEKVLEAQATELAKLRRERITPKPDIQKALSELGTSVLQKPISFAELMRRNEISYSSLSSLGYELNTDPEVYEPVEIAVKYEGYIGRQSELIQLAKKMENILLPDAFDFSLVKGLSREEKEKLSSLRPRTLGQASRISGVNPSGIQALAIYLKSREDLAREN
ncbi:MAG: tRNA uridine-5-carboxymethylaminomethyl(34) synthesis enzyme MnmG, partial [Bdellovibrionales bacterium]|nr:tRNA uridine-5-carboxymethylaminomethyl(34) synthesis enzyme MnmG [Bdellovibrionales bacterium]